MKYTQLSAEEIEKTIGNLVHRIEERFPDSGLIRVGRKLHDIADETHLVLKWIGRPNHTFRWLIFAILLLLAFIVGYSFSQVDTRADDLSLADIVHLTEAALNELVLIGAGIVFLVTIETRRKRKRVISSVNRLRCLVHIIDAHQLTKDPGGMAEVSMPTAHSPKREMNDYELGRYLDYCSELLSLSSKVAFLYIQDFHDPVANNAVNDLENLTLGLQRKIWQKILVLRSQRAESPS